MTVIRSADLRHVSALRDELNDDLARLDRLLAAICPDSLFRPEDIALPILQTLKQKGC